MKDSDKTKEKLRTANKQLKASEQQLREANQQLKENNQQLSVSEKKVRKHAHDLEERLKELDCLYGIAESIRIRETIEEILQDTANIIPMVWHYPDITRGKVRFDGKEYVSSTFKETKWKQSADIIVNGKKRGSIEVYYLEERPKLYEGPFMKEERDLIDGVRKVICETIERKLTEEELRKSKEYLSELLKTFSDAVFTVRMPERNISYINGALTEIFGYTPGEVIGKSTRMFYIDEKDYQLFGQKLQNAIHDKLPGIHIEQELLKKNGETIWTEIATTFLFDGEKLSQVISVIRNISERKQAEEKIRISEEKFRILYENSPFGIILCEIIRNKEGKAIDFINLEANESTGVNTGVQLYDIVGKKASEIVDKKKQSELTEKYEKVVVTHRSVSYIQYFDVYKKTLQVTASYLYDDKFIINFMDISEQKKAEDEIISARDTAERYLDVAGSLILTLNPKGEIRMINQKGLEILEYSQDELIGKNWSDTCVPIDGIKEIKQVFAKIICGEIKSLDYYENEVVTKSGEVRTISWFNTILRNEEGDITSVLSSGVDITERKQAEEKLRESEEKYRVIFEATGTATLIVDRNTTIIEANKECEFVTGYIASDLVGKSWTEFVYKEDLLTMLRNSKARIKDPYSVPNKYEARLINAKGEVRNTILSVGMIPDSKSSIVSMIDITELKQAEDEINLLAQSLRSINDCVSITDTKDIIFFVNDAFLKTYGYTKEELIGTHISILRPKHVTLETGNKILNKTIESGWSGEIINQKKDGTVFPVYLSTSVIRDDKDNLFGLVGVATDITERKQAEEALQKSEEQYKDLVEKGKIAIAVDDIDGNIIYFNKQFSNLFGYSAKEIKSKTHKQFIHPDSFEMISNYHKMRMQGKSVPSRYEFLGIRKDGSIINIEIDVCDVIKEEGKILGTRSYMWDITERKQAEKALRESEKELNAIFNGVKNGIVLLDKTGKIIRINKYIVEIGGFPEKKIVGKRFGILKMFTPKSTAKMLLNFSKILKGKDIPPYEVEAYTNKGEKKIIQIHYSFLKKEDKVEGVIVILTDITERKRTAKIQKTLFNISNAVNKTRNLDELYPAIHQYFGSVVDNTNFFIALYDDETDMISFPYFIDEYDAKPEPIYRNQSKGLTEYIFSTKKPLFVNNQLQNELAEKGEIELIGAGSKIWLGAPLIIQDKVIGVIALQSYHDPNLYSEKDIEILTFVSEEIALAINKKRSEEQIKGDLQEKTTLLKELYHRTKNNMQVISSMLKMQSRNIENLTISSDKLTDFLYESFNVIINRIKSMSMVHEKLYKAQDLSHINLKEYIKDLTNSLISNYNIHSESISLKLELEDMFVLIDLAIPLGLVLNEMISNVFKHAYSDNRELELTIRLYKEKDETMNIQVCDNGVGIPKDIDLNNVNTIGIQTIFNLIKYQLKGHIRYDTDNGLKWHIRLKDNIYKVRV